MNTRFKASVTGVWLVLALLGIPFDTAYALVIADSTITMSNLRIVPAAGALVMSPLDVQATVDVAFNSLGESTSDGDFGTGTDVSADAVVTYAQGHAQAKASAGTVSASSAINLPGFLNAAGVTSPGSLGILSGTFAFTGATGMVEVFFSMDVVGSVHGFADAAGMFETDADASLEIDGTPLLFDLFLLSGGPDFSDTTQPFSETLTATLSLDSALSHFFIMTAHSDITGINLPEPGSLALILAGLGAVCAQRRRGKRNHITN